VFGRYSNQYGHAAKAEGRAGKGPRRQLGPLSPLTGTRERGVRIHIRGGGYRLSSHQSS